jgi:acetyl-CoA C-acetyltransferase
MVKSERKVAVVGAWEHPTRFAPDKSDFQFMQECAAAALDDAGLSVKDVDGMLTVGYPQLGHDLSDPGPNRMADYLNIDPNWVDTTYVGGSSLQFQLFRAAMAIELGLASCILVTYAARPRSKKVPVGTAGMKARGVSVLRATQESFEDIYGVTVVGMFALNASRHMHLYGTTDEHLAQVAVTIRSHAQLNPDARYRAPLTVEEVMQSRLISSPLRLLNVCAITDGGGALVLASPEVARGCKKPPVWMIGAGEGFTKGDGGYGDWLDVGTRKAADTAFGRAGIKRDDVDTVQIYDATAFHIIQGLEELGFCKRGEGGSFIDGGKRIKLGGELPVNTDGGGLSSNQAITRGIFVVLEAVRQVRGECGDRQVKDCRIAIASGTGGGGPGGQSYRRSASVLIFGRD